MRYRPLLFALSLVAYSLAADSMAAAAHAAGPAVSGPQANGQRSVAVRIDLEASGVIGAAEEDKQPNAMAGAKQPAGRPFQLAAQFAYTETPLAPAAGAEDGAASLRVLRDYRTAEATITVGKTKLKPRLAESNQLLAVESTDRGLRFASLAGPLTREELDLVMALANPIAADRLIPTGPLREGMTWELGARALGPLVALESVTLGEASGVVDAVSGRYARLRFAGAVHGLLDGAETEYDLEGVALLDRRTNRLTRLNLGVAERRAEGPATPAMRTKAKARITFASAGDNRPGQSGDAIAEANRRLDSDEERRLALLEPGAGVLLLHDAAWRPAGVTREAVTLKRVAGEELVGQTTLRRLPPKRIERQPTVEEFANEMRRTLADHSPRIGKTEQWTSPGGERCLRIVSHGVLDGSPVEWRHGLVIAAEGGPSVSFATTIYGTAEALGEADRELQDALRFTDAGPTEQAKLPGDTVR
ncbi:hypothetical protein Mal64_26030 [Pseudobythopirellula maris]|uniref:SLA1 homology domain-containing protein n=1 Tax=Pseudobythopirellula maris TaxID=2527991 RepID=A0A5C5ZQN8_9BACT|nr:hypothetical protein [Pseudobythopirellula maris]TWT89111.1 hypothetical protein Mal64_26030 [Pseudobythopirellula maris]